MGEAAPGRLYLPGGPTRGEPVTVAVHERGVRARTEDGLLVVELPFEGATIALGGYEDAFLVLREGETELWIPRERQRELEALRPALPEAFVVQLDEVGARARRGGVLRALVGPWAALAVLGALGAWVATGGLIDALIGLVPYDVDLAIGEAFAAELDEQVERCDDDRVVELLQAMAERVGRQVPGGAPKVSLRVWVDDTPNAFAAPGGAIWITTGLLSELETPDQAAMILGHELAHVQQRHHVRRLLRVAGVAVVGLALMGDVSTATAYVAGGAGLLTGQAFAPGDERVADTLGARWSAAAGYDPRAGAEVMAILARHEEGGGEAWLSSHPPTEDRRRFLERFADELEARGEAPPVEDWDRVRVRCGG